MKRWKQASFWSAIVGLAVATMLSVVLMHAAEKPDENDKQPAQRLFKFKTSDPNGMNIATQMKFQPGDSVKMKFSVESGNKTNSIEFQVKSDMTVDPPRHSIEAHFTEQIGKAKPMILRRPRLKITESVPAGLQLNEFLFEVVIEPVN